ncbi:MAG: hypothetical protein IT313_09060 [Anaerolineales bacterium]|nr:hypothetical protein [Anaerolineales bacterium]
MNFKKIIWLLAGYSLLVSGCTSKPKFINHPAPDLAVSFEPFNDTGALAALGCDEIYPPSNLLGGLEPPYPIATCAIHPGEGTAELQAEIESGQFIYYTGGLLGNFVRYVVHKDGEFVLLKTEDDFRKMFAPVESPDEALSYALAVRNLAAYYGIQYIQGYKYEVDTIEDTFVSSEADGYLVHLFYDQVFGCGPHWTSTVDAHVSVEGNVDEVGGEAIFRDPNLDELCVD